MPIYFHAYVGLHVSRFYFYTLIANNYSVLPAALAFESGTEQLLPFVAENFCMIFLDLLGLCFSILLVPTGCPKNQFIPCLWRKSTSIPGARM